MLGAYPINLILGLSMVNNLESLGIERHFKHEIKEVLDDVYRYLGDIFLTNYSTFYELICILFEINVLPR